MGFVFCCDAYGGRKDPHSRAIVLTPHAPAHLSFNTQVLPLRVEQRGLSRNETLSNLASSICDCMTTVIQLPRTKSTSTNTRF